LSNRRILLAISTALALALVLVSGASGEPIVGYTAAGSPSHVKPLTLTSFTIALNNATLSPKGADEAKIGIPLGFVVDPASVRASAGAAGACVASTWVALVADGKINLKRSGGAESRLCPGATLTVVFSATSAAADGTYIWATELLRGDEAFFLSGSQPTVQVDGKTPVVTISSHPANPSNVTSPSFEFSASESASFQCKLDSGAFAACPSPGYDNLVDGSHTITVQATDAAGNTGETSYSWTIDTAPPTVTITEKPSDPSGVRLATVRFSAAEPSTFQCNLDGSGFEPCSSPASYAGLADGGHAFGVRATDAAGNVGAASASWTIDATAPQTTIDSAPALRTTARSAVFTFSASESATFQCRLDGGSFAPCGSPSSYAGLASGVHRFAVRAIDAAGNVDATPAGSEWTVAVVTRTVARSALFAPAAGARVTRPPLLRWRPVRGATYYNVQLYRAGRKVLTAWPTQTRLQLRAQWRFNGRAQRLEPGVYRWYVWPGRGQITARRYGKVLGSSTFVVRPAASRR